MTVDQKQLLNNIESLWDSKNHHKLPGFDECIRTWISLGYSTKELGYYLISKAYPDLQLDSDQAGAQPILRKVWSSIGYVKNSDTKYRTSVKDGGVAASVVTQANERGNDAELTKMMVSLFYVFIMLCCIHGT